MAVVAHYCESLVSFLRQQCGLLSDVEFADPLRALGLGACGLPAGLLPGSIDLHAVAARLFQLGAYCRYQLVLDLCRAVSRYVAHAHCVDRERRQI